MAWRSIAGGVLGFVLWWFLFFAVGIGIGAIWPEYREAARMMFQEGDMSGFVFPLLLANFCLFFVNGTVVGWFSVFFSRNRAPSVVLAALFLVYMIVNHYILEWDQFPPWYNLIVPVIISGSILLGSCLVRVAPLHAFVRRHSNGK